MYEQLKKVEESMRAGANPADFVLLAKAIADIALESYSEELLKKALDIAAAISNYANELEMQE